MHLTANEQFTIWTKSFSKVLEPPPSSFSPVPHLDDESSKKLNSKSFYDLIDYSDVETPIIDSSNT